jgi:pyruvate kinase
MPAEILCTLGPASLNTKVIHRLEALGVSLFRINLSHTSMGEIESVIRSIQERTGVPVCLDTEGAQIRTGTLPGGSIEVRENAIIRVLARTDQGDPASVTLYPGHVVERLKVGDFLTIDIILAQVISEDCHGAMIRVMQSGMIGKNKAVTVHRPLSIPPLTDKDRKAIEIGKERGIRHVALSFAHRGSDVDHIRALAGKEAYVISKIECREALRNLKEIAKKSDAILVDRGDLSREVAIERIPSVQESVVGEGKKAGVKVYVATNFLASMITAPTPTRGEVNDIYHTLRDGVDGLVLAGETAIGKYPIKCAAIVRKLIDECESRRDKVQHEIAMDAMSSLVEPHGGRLIERMAEQNEIPSFEQLPSITLDGEELTDCEQIALGTFSPLRGFMDRETLESVLEKYCLKNGVVWTLPIVLQTPWETARHLERGQRIALRAMDGKLHSIMDITDVYTVDLDRIAEKWFGTTATNHPGVARLMAKGPIFVGGDITLVCPLKSAFEKYILTPMQTRFVFTHKGWDRIVGFHSRNVAHRVHEYIQLRALEMSHADGLLISPVIGAKKQGDFLPGPILKSYEAMIESGLYPENNVIVSGFNTYSRYAGPREAVFTALCRKNMGCSHFIVGRDHTGVVNYYPADGNQGLFDKLGDIGIAPIFFEAIGYDEESGQFVEVNSGRVVRTISGTEIRKTLMEGGPLFDWMMRPVVQDVLRAELLAGGRILLE